MSEWQPIETAPKDKGLLLWWTPKDPNPYAEAVVVGQVSSYKEEGAVWWNGQTGIYQSLQHITHWQPLPEPPKGNAAQKSGEFPNTATHLGHEDQSNITEKVSQP